MATNSFDTAQLQQFQNNNQDIGKILKQLISPTANPQSAQGMLGPATLSQLGKAGVSTEDAIGPYQQGVAKALKQMGEQHTAEALQQNVPPQHIEQQAGLSKNDPTQMLANIIATHLASQNNAQQGNIQTNNTVSNQQNAMDTIQKQASDIASNPNGFMGRFSQNFDNIIGLNKQRLDNLAQAQKIIAGQPSDIGLPQAQIGQLQAIKKQTEQQIAGLTPEQQASAIGSYNSALIQQHNELQKSVTDQITSTATAIDQLVKNTPMGDKMYGSPYYDTLKALQTRLQGLTNQGKGVVESFDKLKLVNPRTGKTDTSQSTKYSLGDKVNYGGKSYTFKGINPKTGKAILE